MSYHISNDNCIVDDVGAVHYEDILDLFTPEEALALLFLLNAGLDFLSFLELEPVMEALAKVWNKYPESWKKAVNHE